MTLKEAENLREQNLARTLRMPVSLQSVSEQEMNNKTNIRWGVCYLIKKLSLEKNCSRSALILKSTLRNVCGVEEFYGMGTKVQPFYIKTDWAEGKFFNARHLFRNLEYPNYIEKRFCFSNCYLLAKNIGETNNLSCKVLSGIAFVKDYPILHTVLELDGGWIVDFNYDICMEKDLYFSIFAFETLTELTSQEIFVKDRLLTKYEQLAKNYGHGYRVFALDDLVDYVENRAENQVEERTAIENF